jgi:cytochrome P450
MPKYSAISGHLLVLKEQVDKLPADCTINTPFLMMTKDYPDGIFYFDLWPVSKPLLLVSTTSAASQVVHAPLDKPDEVNAALQHLTGGPNLLTMREAAWKPWRSLFNPGFSAGYMQELVPAIAKETKVFHDILRQHANSPALVQLEHLTLKLTIDVIGAVSMYVLDHYRIFRLNQLTGPQRQEIPISVTGQCFRLGVTKPN